MASLRTLTVVRTAGSLARNLSRSASTKASSANSARSRAALLAGSAAAGLTGYGIYKSLSRTTQDDIAATVQAVVPSNTLAAASPPKSQDSVWSPGKDHAVYLWIHLKPEANLKEVAKVCSKLPKMVDTVVDPTMKDEDDEILAGVGFGPNFYAQVAGKTKKSFVYPHRKGALGDMPSSGGDVFIHAKSNQVSKLFELSQLFLRSLPKDSVQSSEDIYSFVYQNGRDLSGFIDGTENRADDEGRQEVAVEKETGGSYVITQKWIHDLNLINTEKPKNLEAWVGRERGDSTEISRKSITSHVARMTGGNGFQQPKPVEIVRQSMPFGSVSGEAGLFFIGYAADPYNFEFMLDRMVGAGGDRHSDDVMRLSKNVKGTYWYFPGEQELAKLA
ncbi:Dyp-type peroxidase yfex-like protein [Plakobranchus ocellatus]|uniref:Dyp-type peroxidase yfex-like protein n=1 Tax=Plakobranchus ocellatus TaxID=259542 RepID=A0AAV4A721_9GAST|nr:Dyp-type peroxidase yfex-like protein [Plakobranchus ocellatus]